VKEFLSQKGIEFTEKIVTEDDNARKELTDMGHLMAPVLLIDGQKIIGFDPNKIEAALS
jgi:glutaredoxin